MLRTRRTLPTGLIIRVIDSDRSENRPPHEGAVSIGCCMSTRLELDKTVYRLEAVQKAAYRFIDRMTVLISQDGDKLVCEMTLVKGDGDPSGALLADFKRELLDQELRLQIKEETAPTRDLILAYAFSRTGLQG
ncbi:hypothetical protein GCM10009079_00750 [Ralstonia mannitolilytica]